MHSRISLLLILFCFIKNNALKREKRIIGGVPADIPPIYVILSNITRTTTEIPSSSSEQLVFVSRGRRSALVNGIKNEDGSYSFLGLRYAEPPLKRFRFQRPRKLKLRGEIDATKFGSPCAQLGRGKVIGSEDCLFLNVFTPELPAGKGSSTPSNPVLVWIHGGNFRTGSAAQYVPTELVKKGIVVVTVQYRLGSLGFLSIGRKELPGNTGLFDISTALRWVNDYIRFFGGDPKRITSGGQGSGASCATMLALNKYSKRPLNGVLAMSGTPVSPFALDENERRSAGEVSNETGSICNSEEGIQFVRCMQKLPLETILKADSGLQGNRLKKERFPKGLANLLVPGPSEEGKEDERFLPHFLPISPLDAIKKGLFPSIPLLTGVTKEETGGGCRGNFLKEIQKKLFSPNFLQSTLFTEALYANNGLFVNKTVNPQLSSLFLNGDYLKFFTVLISSALSDMEKIIKHTTDAFFNLPAFITSHLWAKKSNVFLYSFEHTPLKSLAQEFLPDLPLVALSDSKMTGNKKGPEHGDDLMFLFDVRTLEGNLLDNLTFSEADLKVRDLFSTMVADFVRSGKPTIGDSDEWKPFKPELGNYMIIRQNPVLAANFHKCEMGMWTGDNNILGSSDCSILNQATEVVTSTIGSAGSTLLSTADSVADTLGVNNLTGKLTSSITKPLDENLGKVGGSLLGGLGITTSSSTTVKTVRTTPRPAAGGGGLLGGRLGGGLLG